VYRRHLLFIIISFLSFEAIALSATLKVPAPFPSIQDAIDWATDGDTVLVSPGTYFENIDFSGKLITVRSEDPYSTAIVQATIIDGGQAGSVVTFKNDEGLSSILAGFTITNGSGTSINQYERYGGGIYCEAAQPTIGYNIIRDNNAIQGGGIFCRGIEGQVYSPRIENNEIHDNLTEGTQHYVGGGGILCMTCSPSICNNEIHSNEARKTTAPGSYKSHGGGVYCADHCSALVENNEIYENLAEIGGGLCDREYSSSTFRNNIVRDNRSGGDGGGISINVHSSTLVERNVIFRNFADPDLAERSTRGGGIRIDNGYDLTNKIVVRNNLIQANEASRGGGIIIRLSYQNVVLSGNTISDNHAYIKGGGFCITNNSHPTIKDTIIWGNSSEYPGAEQGCIDFGDEPVFPSFLSIEYSDLNENEVFLDTGCLIYSGDGMINADPLFEEKPQPREEWETKFLDQVTPSPCLDAADPLIPVLPLTTDKDGTPDVGILDMGYHYPIQ